jgi:hypothetical protein
MNKETIQDLLVTKFYASPKNRQEKLLGFMLENANEKQMVVDFLNNKKLSCKSKGFKEGDHILIPHNISSYPSMNFNYYHDNDLIINDVYISVLVDYINPVTGYIGIKAFTESSPEETIVEVYYGNIPDQKQLTIM